MPKTAKEVQSVRLFDHVKPEHYWLSLVPDFDKFTFSGEEIITLELNKPESTIRLHAKELKISEAFITDGDSEWRAKVTLDQESEQASLEFESQLKKGTYNLNLKFSGALTDNMRGFYRSQFQVKGKTEYMAVTQFEPTDARRAFPCFDEPAQKATFAVELAVPPGMEAISNTIVTNKTRTKRGWQNYLTIELS
jgi:aminopeptidase N